MCMASDGLGKSLEVRRFVRGCVEGSLETAIYIFDKLCIEERR